MNNCKNTNLLQEERKILLMQCDNGAYFQSISRASDAGGVIRTQASGVSNAVSDEAGVTRTLLPLQTCGNHDVTGRGDGGGWGDITPEMCDYIRRGADVRSVLVKSCSGNVDHSRLSDTAIHFKAKLERARSLFKCHVHHAAGNRLGVCARQNFGLLRSKGAICDAVAVHSP